MYNILNALRVSGYRCVPLNQKKVATVPGWKSDEFKETEFNTEKNLIGLVCGSYSQGLEVVDVDSKTLSDSVHDEFITQFLEMVLEFDQEKELSIYKTVSGGLHVLYRCDNYSGNMKISCPPDEWTDKPTKEALFETRGQGGYVVAYVDNHIAGHDYTNIKKITNDKRNELIELCRLLGKQPLESKQYNNLSKPINSNYQLQGNGDPIAEIKNKYKLEDVLSNEFTFSNPDGKGNVNVLRNGSKAVKSGTIFHNNKSGSSLYLHSTGTQYPANQMLDVIEVMSIQNSIEPNEIISSFIKEFAK